jgi:hypothetical protein
MSTSENDDISYTSNQLSSATGFNKNINRTLNNSTNKNSSFTNSKTLFRINEYGDSRKKRSSDKMVQRSDKKVANGDYVKIVRPGLEGHLKTIDAQLESEETSSNMIKEIKVSPLQNQDL